MKVAAHTKSEEQADPRQLFFQIPPSRGLHFALHYKAIGRVLPRQSPTRAWQKAGPSTARERASHDHAALGMTGCGEQRVAERRSLDFAGMTVYRGY
jgi:hypothetical protein